MKGAPALLAIFGFSFGCLEPTDDLERPERDAPEAPTPPEAGPDDTPRPDPEPVAAPPLELCINEFMPANQAALVMDAGTTPDWVELHNPTDGDVWLDGWTITDDVEEPDKHSLDGDLVVPAGGFLVLLADGSPELGPDHLDFRLDADGESIALYRYDGSSEIVSFGSLTSDIAAARIDDCCEGDDCWDHAFGGTPGLSNSDW